MSFLESIQHGLEKASQEAARITRIQHLHNISDDLTFKASQQGEALIAQAMDMYHKGHLGQGELVGICQQIATYQQQISEVQAELQRLQKPEDHAEEQASPMAPAPATYPAYPQAAPPQAYAAGTAPTSYLPPQPNYPAQPGGYPTAAVPVALGTYPVQQSYPVPASAPVQPVAPPAPTSSEPPTKPGVPRKHAAHTQSASAAVPAGFEPTSTVAPGSYEQGVLPPIYSPFANQSTPVGSNAAAEPEKATKVHHSAKADTGSSASVQPKATK